MGRIKKFLGIKPKKVVQFQAESDSIVLESAASLLNHVVFDLDAPEIDKDNLLCCAGRVGILMQSQGIETLKLNHNRVLTLKEKYLTMKTLES